MVFSDTGFATCQRYRPTAVAAILFRGIEGRRTFSLAWPGQERDACAILPAPERLCSVRTARCIAPSRDPTRLYGRAVTRRSRLHQTRISQTTTAPGALAVA